MRAIERMGFFPSKFDLDDDDAEELASYHETPPPPPPAEVEEPFAANPVEELESGPASLISESVGSET